LISSHDRPVWQYISAEPNDGDIVPKEIDGPVYQISSSGLAARGTYLINTFSGAAWILYEDPDEGIFLGSGPISRVESQLIFRI
jgi:hypothetical protein